MTLSKETIKQLYHTHGISNDILLALLATDTWDEELFAYADRVRREIYGDAVYVRGLIEFSNYCKNDCYYCGIRAGNCKAVRYRLTKQEILDCCREGYRLGMRTFVLQSGEDAYFTDERICDIVSSIHSRYPDCAITLSVGEKSRESYLAYHQAGARRYLLRHEAASDALYAKLHPEQMQLARRKQCLQDLKEIGYQVGAGFMVGAPYQTLSDIVSDLRFLQTLDPDMIGIGPYITHNDTPFSGFESGSLSLTLRILAIVRLMFPHALLPATTALATISPDGRERGLKAGANVVMPNLSPLGVRQLYNLYENKNCTGAESAQCSDTLCMLIEKAGYHAVTDIGDVKRPL
ncbi:MAG: [FeFe] hydrogenase H-cluster radical SAM maturase HydE [Lachnospiraceae bacterium]|nr:[FeFe] hydrogenase H-cluster radical SAM maturase HydE [Lachnospiraceae bacterium]